MRSVDGRRTHDGNRGDCLLFGSRPSTSVLYHLGPKLGSICQTRITSVGRGVAVRDTVKPTHSLNRHTSSSTCVRSEKLRGWGWCGSMDVRLPVVSHSCSLDVFMSSYCYCRRSPVPSNVVPIFTSLTKGVFHSIRLYYHFFFFGFITKDLPTVQGVQ